MNKNPLQLKSPNPQRPFQILALDGGGIKGLFSAAVLATLEEDLNVKVTDHFDLVTGTSTGGLIALALGAGLKPRDIVEFYVKEGPQIFGGVGWQRWLRQYIRSKYDQEPLKAALQATFGEQTLANSQKRLVIPAYSLDSDQVYIFKTPHHERLRRDWRVPLWQVALATSAAPTFFPASRHTGNARLVDGGVWANNPSVVGIAEAVSVLGVPLNKIKVFNLGTSSPVKERHERLTQGGLYPWALEASDVILTAQSRGTHGVAGHLVGSDNIVRLDPLVADDSFKLDRLDIEKLMGLAHEKSRHFSPTYERAFSTHRAAPYAPLYPSLEEAA